MQVLDSITIRAVHLSFPPTGSVRRRRRPEIASCGFGFIKDWPAGFGPTRRSFDLVDPPARFVRVYVNRVAVLVAHRPSVEPGISLLLLGSHEAADGVGSAKPRISLIFRATPGRVLYFTSGCI